ncbi:MAG TPA: ABC transporter substrate-binding protein [Candidatus Binatia bacterium]|nr:ABC transporter substrate-binding protein [Candidatus Binatia bacterium]
MDRKIVVYLAVALVVNLAQPTHAQQSGKVHRIGVLSAAGAASFSDNADALRQGLRDLGYVEGKNLTIEYRYADGKIDRLTELATDLVRLKADVIASLAKPGGNVTGLASMQDELGGKRLELLKEAFPKVSSVAVLWNPEEQSPAHGFKELQSVAPSLGVKLQSFEVRKPNEIDKVFAGIAKRRVDAVLVESDPVFNINRAKIIDHAAKGRLPAMYPERRWVKDGGLLGYGTDLVDLARRSAVFIDKILKGTKPVDLPVEQPMKFELTINLKAAKQIGVVIQPEILARATTVIR